MEETKSLKGELFSEDRMFVAGGSRASSYFPEISERSYKAYTATKNYAKDVNEAIAAYSGKFARTAILTLTLAAAGAGINCGGGGNPNPPPPPPPPPATFTVSGTVFDVIADNDPAATAAQKQIKLGGIVELLNASGSRVASSAISTTDGSYSMVSVPSGTYTVKISDNRGGLDYVMHEDANVTIGGTNTTITRNEYVTPRGNNVSAAQNNRFGVPFDMAIIEPWYRKFAQREHLPNPGTITGPGVLKVDVQNLPIREIIIDDSVSQPEPCRTQLETLYGQFKMDAVRSYTDARLQDLTMRRGQPSDNTIFVTLDPTVTGPGAVSDWPATNGKNIIRARTRWNQTAVCQALSVGSDISSAVYEELAHNFGIPDYQDPNVQGVTNETPGLRTQRPTNAEKLGFAIVSHPHTKPGNRAADRNP